MASYRVVVTDAARREIRRAPGGMRQRIMRLLRDLEQEPRPSESRVLDTPKAAVSLKPGTELRRIRLAAWRVVCLLDEGANVVTVLAVRKRPPYQYDDLAELLADA
jgi:mRNA-degrading endonuclease RelE of RelBE toxin-antitoxin system